MTMFERVVCVAVPLVIANVCIFVGKPMVMQAANSSTAGIMGTMTLCTGLLCGALVCVIYPLVRTAGKKKD